MVYNMPPIYPQINLVRTIIINNIYTYIKEYEEAIEKYTQTNIEAFISKEELVNCLVYFINTLTKML